MDSQQRKGAQNEIIAILNTVEGVHNVHNRRLNMTPPDEFMEASFVESTERVHCWWVTRTATQTLSSENAFRRVAFGRLLRVHTFQIAGYSSFKENPEDPTENTDEEFQDLVDDVITRFNEEASLNESTFTALPIQLLRLDHDFLGDVMCHYAEMQIQTYEEVTGLTRR